ncbi:MAG: hypothetical protein JWN45_2009 [Acidobacteriaceae bacterium]|jgi:hypothetical protein|nr:hypothetical protein [Acidobacteriaceae bacterium]
MPPSNVGRLQRVALREVWKHEAQDFTQWLQNNIDVLNESLDFNLVGADRERSAGDFSVDLVAEDEDGGTVIIENQLEKSNHDHLGKLITYLTAIGAKTAIWIVSDPRPEHVAAIGWLNSSSSAEFYMVKVEAVRIADSAAAPLFTLIVGPSVGTKEVGEAKKEIAERYFIRKRWWKMLIERSAAVSKTHAHITPSEHGWISASAGVRGLSFNYVVMQDECRVELYIDRGKDSDEENKRIFDELYANCQGIEQAFGGTLIWERLDARRASRIQYTRQEGGYRSPEEQWPEIQDKTIRDMDRFEKALQPYLKQLRTIG